MKYKKKPVKNINMWKLNNMVLNDQRATEEITEEIKKKTPRDKENKSMMIQNMWDTAKAVVRGKFTATQSHLRKQEHCQINNLNLHPKQLEKEEQTKPKV